MTADRSPAGWLAASVAGWLATVIAAAMGIVSLSVIDQIVLLGIAVVLPLAIGGRWWWWQAAAGCAFVAFLLPAGRAGLLVLPFLAVALATSASRLRQAGPLLFWRSADVVDAIAASYAVVAAGALLQSRCGVELLGIHEPIVELTAVHYTFAGSAALVLAAAAAHEATGRWRRAGAMAVVCTAAAPPVVAAGFVTAWALPQVGGAVLMTMGVWLTASLQLRAIAGMRCSIVSTLLAISGLAVWVPMVLAVAWAGGQHWDVPILSIPDMARTHGLANALAFVGCGLLARRFSSTANTGGPAVVAA